MDDTQCRTCLSEAVDSRFSLKKRVDGCSVQEKLEFITGMKISNSDSFSKVLCKKCFADTFTAFSFKMKCLTTDKTLKNLEKKFQQKLEELILKKEIKSKEVPAEVLEVESHPMKEEQLSAISEQSFAEQAQDQSEFYEEFYEAEEESVPEADEIYEEVEYLEHEVLEEVQVNPQKIQKCDKDKLSCEICVPHVNFKTEFGVQRHLWEVHMSGSSNPLICKICQYVFNGDLKEEQLAKVVKIHNQSHSSGKNQSCSHCPEVFKTFKKLEQHRKQHSDELESDQGNFRCKACLCRFSTADELRQHVQASNCREIHEKPFKCYICKENFSMGIEKKRHILNEHSDMAGADCPLCVRCKIPSAIAFENHYKTHFAGPRFCCSFCGRSFHESDRLQTHIKRIHENAKFSCNWCNRTFKDKSGIARHILGVHFNQRNHQCNICPKAFTASYNLKEHLFSVHGVASKFYTCEICSQDFLYRKQYERHRNKCNGVPEKRRR